MGPEGERGIGEEWAKEVGIPVFWGLYPAGIWLVILINGDEKLSTECNTRIGQNICLSEGFPSFQRKMEKLPRRYVCYPHISPQHGLKNTRREDFTSAELEAYFESIMSLFISLK